MGNGTARRAQTVLLAVLLAGGATLLFPMPSDATTTPLDIIVPSGPLTTVEGSPLELTLTIKNVSGSSDTVAFISVSSPAFLSGDPTDTFTGSGESDACIGTTLAIGAECTVHLSYATAPDSGEVDEDSGVSTATFIAADLSGNSTAVTYDLTVQDPVPTPEPSSLLLTVTGLGLLGAGLIKRRFAHQLPAPLF